MIAASFSLLFSLLLAPFVAAKPPVEADFFVATDGSDDNPGTGAKPFATLTRAREAVRQLKSKGPHRADVMVLVRGGTYHLKETLVFGPDDSGTLEHRIVYAAYPGEKPILSGGRGITGWKPGEGKRWVAKVLAERGSDWRFTQVFVDGKRQTRSRLPDTDDWRRWWQVAPGPNHQTVFKFAENTLENWQNLEEVEINLLPQYYWQNQIIPLAKVDQKTRTATLAVPPPAYAICPGNPFRAENVPEGVTRPGTWALDTRTGTLTLWPEAGVELVRSVVTAPALATLVRCEGNEKSGRTVRGLTFRGLTFTQTAQVPLAQRDPKDTGTLDTNDSAFLLEGAENCAIEDCRFLESGGYGVRLRHRATGNRVTGNEFAGCGGGGVLLTGYGPGTTDVNRGNLIADNHVHHCGAFYWHAPGISGTQSGDNRVAFNHVHDMPYAGIMFADCSVDYFKEFRGRQGRGFNFRWDEIGDGPLTRDSVKRFTHSRKNVIEFNTIHHVVQRLEDGGGIYVAFSGSENVVRNNLISAVHGGRMAVGIYMDAETDAEVIEGNVVWDCDLPHFDNGETGDNHNKWGTNVMVPGKTEPAEARVLRETIAAKRKNRVGFQEAAPAPERPAYQIGNSSHRANSLLRGDNLPGLPLPSSKRATTGRPQPKDSP
ncbi:MAG TPA: right-handed parallel beta-helix repeat-containing protein [Gemmataceae bacterium]|nr:right-handed parallel beta-helix repeat-containing protein [Gemmataceae bacterium]